MQPAFAKKWFGAAFLVVVFVVGCEKDPPLDTSQELSTARHVFAVEFPFPTPERKVRSLLGIQGSPASVIPGDIDIGQSYEQYGFEMVRIPQDDFCSYTLEGIFQDPDAPESDLLSYEFGNIDRLVEGIMDIGGEVLWQATYDLGISDGCGETDGRHSGQVIRDPTKHVNVVNNILRHFNDGESEWDPDGRDFGVRYVEYVNDPMGLGGYSLKEVEEFFEHFQVFSLGIRAAFSGAGSAANSIKIVGPAHRVRSWPDGRVGEKDFLYDFMDLVADGTVALDVLSLQFRLEDPYEMARVVDDIREYLDDRALVEIPIWITEIAPSKDRADALRAEGDEKYDRYVASYLIAAKIGWQETAERVFPHRGTRRFNGAGGEYVESAFFSADGEERGGLLAYNAFRQIEGDTILRGSAITSDAAALMATRSDKANSISVLVSYPGLGDLTQGLLVPFTINELPDEITEFQWELSEPSEFAPFVFQVQERGTIPVVDGGITYSFFLEPPGVARLDLTW